MTTSTPNLIIIFPDQMRGSSMGFLGKEPVKTPNLDAFAKRSRVLTDAVSNFPVCSPYRAMLMTGKYPYNNGVIGNCNNRTEPYGVELKESDRCWSDVLKDKGYSLGYIGKWHLDSPQEPYVPTYNNEGELKWNDWCPPERRHGFDFWHSYGTFDHHMTPMYWSTDAKRDEFKYEDTWGPEFEANMAINYLKNTDGSYRKADEPFAMVVSMNPPHTPYDQVPDKYKELYNDFDVEAFCQSRPSIPPAGTPNGDLFRKSIKNYYAMITGVDEQVGRIIDTVEDLGLSEDTIILFTSDHGDCIGEHEFKHKPAPYEEAFQVPFIISQPGTIEPGTSDLLLSAPDIYPTLLGLMGFNPDIPSEVDGQDLAKQILDPTQPGPDSQLYTHIQFDNPNGGYRGIRDHQHTLFYHATEDGSHTIKLFDRKNDPLQLNDIAKDNPNTVATLTERLKAHLNDTNDPWGEKTGFQL